MDPAVSSQLVDLRETIKMNELRMLARMGKLDQKCSALESDYKQNSELVDDVFKKNRNLTGEVETLKKQLSTSIDLNSQMFSNLHTCVVQIKDLSMRIATLENIK